jgi:ATP-dependent RNA helicase RhlE
MSFKNLLIIDPILQVLEKEGYNNPTPIQQKAIPEILKGNDLIGCAQTGTGKTGAFAIPLLQLLQRENKIKSKEATALILAPTRELAQQIGDSFTTYGKNLSIKNTVIFGGVSQVPQIQKINQGIDVLVATPGRLLDLVLQGHIKLNAIKYFILDEADRMLDMGFIHDIKRIISKLPVKRQTLLFSATMPAEIESLASSLLINPVKVTVTPVSSTVEAINQSVFQVKKSNKLPLLLDLLNDRSIESLLVFTEMKHIANKIAKKLIENGISASAIHGNKSQSARQLALSNFKKKEIRVLVATDIAARGIDIDELGFVLNFDLPHVPESYVHRIGRTGRAGSNGTAISFCDTDEIPKLKSIERLIKKRINTKQHTFSNPQLN